MNVPIIPPNQPGTPLLDRVRIPSDLRNFSLDQLRQLADELRQETIDAVSVTGGHLGASLGVVELTVALHAIFDTPTDRLIWDVGHQAYPHKILTGRRDRIRSLRQGGGLSGFTRRSESEYDPFGTAHSSTSISAGLGMAVARDLHRARGLADDRHVVAVIGDGAMSAGMAYEAMNNAGALHSRLVVVLNDNDMSIAPPVGAMSAYLSRLLSSQSFLGLRDLAARMAKRFPKGIERTARRAEEFARGMLTGGTLFEELGFYYVGPIDGHNLDHLIPVLRNVREAEDAGPILLHVITQKGKGYAPAEASADKLHAVAKFNVVTGEQAKAPAGPPTYTNVFARALIQAAEADPDIVAITAAMPSGTGLDKFQQRFPDRTFDVGIALPAQGEILKLGQGRVLREGSRVAILSLGPRLAEALKAADDLAARGLSTTVADARFAKPLDTGLINQLARHHDVLITVEEGSTGGFGALVMHHLAWAGLLDNGLKFRPMVLPDRFLEHDTPAKQMIEAGLMAKDIVQTVLQAVGP